SASPLALTVRSHIASLERLEREISADLFAAAVAKLMAADRIFVFGLGPSSAMADYFAFQLGRFGFEAASLVDTGLLLADGLHRLRQGDVVVVMAYSRVYREVDALLRRATDLAIPTMLITDTLGVALGKRVDLVLPAARGKTEGFSTHTATLGLIEALLIGLAARRPAETLGQLRELNDLRASLVGPEAALPTDGGSRKHTYL